MPRLAMHASALENIARCRDRYVTPAFAAGRSRITVLSAGAADGEASYRRLLTWPGVRYVAADTEAGSGIDIVVEDPHRLPFGDGTFDVVLAGQLLNRCASFERHLIELVRVLDPRGLLFVLVPSTGPAGTCLAPDALDDLARLAGVTLIARWVDRRGPSRDLVGVLARAPLPASAPVAPAQRPLPTLTPGDPTPPTAAAVWRRRVTDACRAMLGGHQPPAGPVRTAHPERARYTVVLEALHRTLEPRLYVEVGVRHGRSLRLAPGRAIGIDPASRVSGPLPSLATVVSQTSDEFFATTASALIDQPVDLAFIDGLHLFEYALRDFMHLERLASPTGVIAIDDVFPIGAPQAERVCRTGIWMGDVWKMTRILQEYRPDLLCLPIDVSTGGLLLVADLDPGNDVLWDRYNEIVARFSAPPFDRVPDDVLMRTGALDSGDPRVDQLLTRVRERRVGGSSGRMS